MNKVRSIFEKFYLEILINTPNTSYSYFSLSSKGTVMFKEKFASIGLILGSILFGLGSIIVAKVPIGAYAIAFWRLAIAGLAFFLLICLFKTTFPRLKATYYYALLSGIFLAFDLALWHESIYAIGPYQPYSIAYKYFG